MDRLIDYINSKVKIDSRILNEILKSFEKTTYSKDQTIIRKGQYVTKYYYISSGGIRMVIDKADIEITTWLIFENHFFSDLDALKSNEVSKSKICAIGNTVIYSIDAKHMHQLYDQYPKWQAFGREMVEDAFLNVIDALISFQIMDAETRYLKLLSKSDVINRVPLKQLASYLGITPSSLSRIRKNIR